MKIVYIDMDGVIVDFQGAVSKLDIKDLEQYTDHKGVHYDRIPGIFATMEPIPGGIEAYRALLKHYEVYFLSKPCHKNASSYSDKRDWSANHIGEFHASKLILSPVKHLSKGDYLIDDRLVPGFEGEQILFGSEEFPDWKSVLDYLIPHK